ncbi:MAG: hypothetical protein H6548_06815 [Chitinophagales bacterium]|nr:hypothetical protein [Chitinophagales bacterium]HAE14322.1 hypothetical protein [Bacteroidota bacterium]MCB9019174.1 hypothetical protein [Chitinophagales bacterium]MCB9021812.1 hypothetical protein [Chitinophagales bacterium]MCB9030937.1 hypothetical protein [Chitinophagales bacterium]
MRTCTLILSLLLLVSCNSQEKGSLDNEILSRKIFDNLKSGDLEKYRLLIPGKAEYKRYYDLKKWDQSSFDQAYDDMRRIQAASFTAFYQDFSDWSVAEYANTQQAAAKTENVAEASLITKIRVNGEVRKYTCKAYKLNGRWYAAGDFQWVPQ